MKQLYLIEIKNALKSKEYWFGFSVIVVSAMLTAFYNIFEPGIMSKLEVGFCEFFITCTMIGNSLFQITAPVIAIFVCMNSLSVYRNISSMYKKSLYTKNGIITRMFAQATIGSSVFLFSFLCVFLVGLVFFPHTTGSLDTQIGLFKELYPNFPVLYIFLYIIHASVCGSAYALLGLALKLCFDNNHIALLFPLVYYFCFQYISWLFPKFVSPVLFWITPLYTFDIATLDVPFMKNATEILLVLFISLILIYFGYKRNMKQRE